MNELEAIELAQNPDPRAPCVLLIDTSASMSGKPIDALNQGIQAFYDDLMKDELAQRRVEVAIVSFGAGGASVVQDFVTVDDFSPPTLKSGGMTPMGAALETGLDLIKTRKDLYKQVGLQYYRPWVFLITDGEPNDAWEDAAKRAQQEDNDKGIIFFAVGTESANFEKLAKIAPDNRSPLKLKGLEFRELFLWLSQSQQRVSHSKVGDQLALPPIGWAEIES